MQSSKQNSSVTPKKINSEEVYVYKNGQNNGISSYKLNYIRKMRLDLCDPDMIQADSGLLNLKYFEVKKGSYWSDKETQILKEMILKFGVFAKDGNVQHQMKSSEEIKRDKEGNEIIYKPLEQYEEVEIKLRMCKLLGIYDLSKYDGIRFKRLEDIEVER